MLLVITRAVQSSNKAKTWVMVSFLSGIVVIILNVVLNMAALNLATV